MRRLGLISSITGGGGVGLEGIIRVLYGRKHIIGAYNVGIAVVRCPIGHIAMDVPRTPDAHDVATLAPFAPLPLSPVGHAGSPARPRRST